MKELKDMYIKNRKLERNLEVLSEEELMKKYPKSWTAAKIDAAASRKTFLMESNQFVEQILELLDSIKKIQAIVGQQNTSDFIKFFFTDMKEEGILNILCQEQIGTEDIKKTEHCLHIFFELCSRTGNMNKLLEQIEIPEGNVEKLLYTTAVHAYTDTCDNIG